MPVEFTQCYSKFMEKDHLSTVQIFIWVYLFQCGGEYIVDEAVLTVSWTLKSG
jgi:hypothetical protein